MESYKAYAEAWESLGAATDLSSGGAYPAGLLGTLKQIRNGLVGDRGRKLDAVRRHSLRPFTTILELTLMNEPTISLKTETAAVLALLFLPDEASLEASLDAGTVVALVSALSCFLDSPLFLHTPDQLNLARALLHALATLFLAASDFAGPRRWSTMTRAPKRSQRAAKPIPTPGLAAGKGKAAVKAGIGLGDRVEDAKRWKRIQAQCDNARSHLFAHAGVLRAFVNGCILARPSTTSQPLAVPLFQLLQALSFDSRWWTLGILSEQVTAGLVDWLDHATGRALEESLRVLHVFTEANREGDSPQLSFHLNRILAYAAKRLSDPGSAKIRAAAASSVVSLIRDRDRAGSSGARPYSTPRRLVPLLVELLREGVTGVPAEAGFALANLVTDYPDLQNDAVDLGAVTALKAILERASTSLEPYPTTETLASHAMLRESALMALAAMMATSDRPRQAVIDHSVLPLIVSSLQDCSPRVRAAACQCCRALSRAVEILRTALLDEGAGARLLDLVDSRWAGSTDESGAEEYEEEDVREAEEEVSIVAMGALCNLVLDFAPMKQELLERNAVHKVVEIAKARSTEQRVHALRALKNMTCWAPHELKAQVCNTMTWEYIISLVHDADIRIQEHAMSVLRNVACGKPQDIGLVLNGVGEARLLSLLEQRLMRHTGSTARHDSLLIHTLYLLSNIATGNEEHKRALYSRTSLLKAILEQMDHDNPDVRVAAIWSVINLAHREGGLTVRKTPAIVALRSIGMDLKLRELRKDYVCDVRERAEDAYDQMEGRMPVELSDAL